MEFLKFILKILKLEKEKKMNLKEILEKKYLNFENLLSNNNEVLKIMADMEEKLTGEYIFDMSYIKHNIEIILQKVLKTIEHLNELSDRKYLKLLEKYKELETQIKNQLITKIEIPVTKLILSLDELKDFENKILVAGGKVAHLAELKSIGIPVPEGFVITSYAFFKFLEHNNLKDKIYELVEKINIYDLEELTQKSLSIKSFILNSQLPKELEVLIEEYCKKIYHKLNKKCYFSIRSSAILEDIFLNFAGQYSTFLNVPEKLISQKYKEVVSSLFNPRAIFYYKTKGIVENEMVMAVGVFSMIDAKAGGVIYSSNPEDPTDKNLIINAVKGLGKLLVDGTVIPDSFIVKREPNLEIVKKSKGKQEKMLVCKKEGDLEEIILNTVEPLFSITDEEALALANLALIIERYYNEPQDIEWVIDQEGKPYILQARILKIAEKERKLILPTRVKDCKVLISKGEPGYKGIGFGKAFILKDDSQLKDFPKGWILVAPHSDLKYVLVMDKASAIITDSGSITSYMACLAKKYKVPTILNTKIATKIIKHEQEITVDAINCVIYEGKVEELLKSFQNSEKAEKLTKNLSIYKKLKEILKFIVPLNLIDTSSFKFNIENCQTIHDIIRFAHEMAMREMFTIWEKYDSEILAIPLQASIPISILILDLGGGLKEGNLRKITPEDIVSIPFKATLKGMLSIKWPEPRAIDARGFLEMIANTATVPENEFKEMAKRSFCIITKNYMNFSIRLGYHFSLIEAYVSENINNNYIKFFFKGGGAALDRRLRRVWLISEILKLLNFSIEVKNDNIDALLREYDKEAIEKRLEILGKLTGYTKQLDMVLFHDAVAKMYYKDFIKLHMKDFFK